MTHRIESDERLRSILGYPSEAVTQKVHDALNETARDFIAHSPMLFLSTSDADGMPTASPKGDRPGFVHVLDAKTLLIPERKGNRMLVSLRNVLQNPRVGLIFLAPGSGETFRVHGAAELTDDPSLVDRVSSADSRALLVTRVRVHSCYFHCARAFLRSSLWKPQTWPPEMKISFGREIAERAGLTDDDVTRLDARIERTYREDV